MKNVVSYKFMSGTIFFITLKSVDNCVTTRSCLTTEIKGRISKIKFVILPDQIMMKLSFYLKFIKRITVKLH